MRAGVALWLLSAASMGTTTLQAHPERSVLGKKIRESDVARVQQERIDRLEERVQKMSVDGAILAERTRQHREMRLKGNAELRARVEELKAKLESERERAKKDFEDQLMAVREEMWAQAGRDRDALEAELGLRYEGERSKFQEEANERANEVIEEVKLKLEAEAERDRELYAQRAALAEEGEKIAVTERKQLQEEKEQLARQLEEMKEVEDTSRKKIITKFKARENALRKNFEAQLREARGAPPTEMQSPQPEGAISASTPASTSTSTSASTSTSTSTPASKPAPMSKPAPASAWTSKRPRTTSSKMPSSTSTGSVRETTHRAAFKSSGGAAPPGGVSGGAPPAAPR